MSTPRVESILELRRPEHEASAQAWRRNERRFSASEDVYDELRPFSYERSLGSPEGQGERERYRDYKKGPARSYQERKERAVWPEFSQLVVEKFVGLVFGQYPEIDFGALAEADGGWRKEALQKNADGVGSDARGLFAFYFDAMARAMATGRRWVLAEAPPVSPSSQREEREGQRPYLVEYSPTQVPYWRYERGVLQAVRIEEEERVLKTKGSEVTEETRQVHYVMTREGFTGFGTEGEFAFEEGGWWQFDGDGNLIERDGEPMRGTWESTHGEIPMCQLHYDRSSESNAKRTGISNLGRLEVNWMDLFSALINHAWEAGSGSTAFTGVSRDQWDAISEAGRMNAKWFPVPSDSDTGNVGVEQVNGGQRPDAIMAALEKLLEQVMTVVARELTTSANASGRSREVQHLKNNVPRLTNMASNVQEALETSLTFVAQRWGFSDAQIRAEWNKQFDLKTTAERVKQVFELFTEVNAEAPSLFAEMLLNAAESEGLLPSSQEREELETALAGSMRSASTRERADEVKALVNGAGLAVRPAMRLAGFGEEEIASALASDQPPEDIPPEQ
jgi:hypothetical protein